MAQNYKIFKFNLLALLGSFLFFSNCFGITIYVNDGFTTGDVYCAAVGNNANNGLTPATPKLTLGGATGALSIAAATGDVIYIDASTSGEDSISITKSVQIIGAGEDKTIFDNLFGVQRWSTINANNVKISKLTITRYALATDGIAVSITGGTGIEFDRVLTYANVGSAGQGAIFVSGITTSVTFKNSGSPCNRVGAANYGGGFKIDGSTVVFDNCSINNNIVSAILGGGILIVGNTANVTVNRTTFDENESAAGGAICIQNGTLNVNNSCFTGNTTNAGAANNLGGGAVLIQASTNGTTTNVNFNNCSFSNNSTGPASSDGGAVSVSNLNSPTCNVNFTTCSFVNNNAADKGEDVYFDKVNSPTFNVVFKNNTFSSVYSGTQVNLYNADFSIAQIVFDTLLGFGANGDIVADGSGVAITKPEMFGDYTESSFSLPVGLPTTQCYDRFDGACGTATATFACVTENIWNGSSWSRTTAPTIFEHVILNSNYNTLTHGNINACQMTIKPSVVLDISDGTNGTYVYVVNSIFNNGTINVSSKGNLVQVNHPLDLNGEAIVTPNINFTKHTGDKIRWDYVYWSKPISGNVLSNYNTNFDLKYYWDPDYCDAGVNFSYLGWRYLVSEPAVATGFITRVKTAAGTVPTSITLNYSGTSNNGNYNATVKYYDAVDAFRNFTLLGNPYPGAIKFEDFYKDNSDKIYGTVYLWSSNTPYPGSGLYQRADYATFNLTGGVGVPGETTQSPNGILPNGYIASAQGFFIRPKVNGTIVFKNSHRTKDLSSNSQFYKSSQGEINRYWLRISDDNKHYNELLVGYMSGATNEFDDAYDGPVNSLSAIKFYTVLGNEKLIIQGKGDFIDSDRLNMNYELSEPSEMLTISLTKKEGIFTTQKIYLYDKKLGFYQDLTQSDYIFFNDNSPNRFEIIYKLKSLNENQVLQDQVSIEATILNNILEVNSNSNLSKIELYDINGRLVVSERINYQTQIFNKNLNLTSGVYILNVTCTNGVEKSIKILNR
jgi:hypothetical protein